MTTQKNAFGRVDFFKIADAIRTHRDEISQKCGNLKEVGKFLTDKTGVPHPRGTTIKQACEAVGVTLEQLLIQKGSRKHTEAKKFHTDLRTLSRCVLLLFKELGVKPPEELVELFERKTGRIITNQLAPTEESRPLACADPVPAASVKPSTTIPVVNRQ